ncbi:MAG: hypothetical protein Q8867_03315 [Bacteroidota bacterium]|nr:hypothetical protein [Bacteroidota bacterium]
MKLTSKILFAFILLIMVLPSVQKKTHFIHSNSLNGVFESTPQPVFSRKTWLDGNFQDQLRKYVEDSAGFKSDFVRLYNQFDFSLFSIPHAEKIVAGKNGNLFGEQYIESYLGRNFVGKEFIDEKVALTKKLQDKLWNEKKILLLVIFTPDKGTFFPEDIPDHYLREKKDINNYSCYVKKYKEAGVNFIDFNKYWLMMKSTSRYPLYPTTGIHWSCYGAVLAADSLTRYLETKLGRPVPHIVIDKIEVSKKARNEDNDIERTLNLIWEIPHPAYAYPAFHFTSDPSKPKPAALFVGDSFYWNWYNPGLINNIFSNAEFWYYDRDVYPETSTHSVSTTQVDLSTALFRQNVIILMQTNAASGDPGYGFVERVLSKIDSSTSRVTYFESQIRSNPDWLKAVGKKAKERNIPLEEMIRRDAQYMVDQELMAKQPKKHQP